MKLQKENGSINTIIETYKTNKVNEKLNLKDTKEKITETIISILRLKDTSKKHEIIIKDKGSLGFEVIFKADKEIIGTWDTSIINNIYDLTSQNLWDKYGEQIIKEFEDILGYELSDLKVVKSKQATLKNSDKRSKSLKEFLELPKDTQPTIDYTIVKALEDHEEVEKKVEEIQKESKKTIEEITESIDVEDRKKLAELISEAKKANKKFSIVRSTKEGYRYVFTTKTLNEIKEDLEEDESEFVKYELSSTDSPDPEIEETDLTQVEENAFTSMITSTISKEWDSIDNLKSVVATFTLKKPELTSVVDIINIIVDEKTVHIGMLQKSLELINGNQVDLIKAGEEKAEIIDVEPAKDLNKE